MDKPTCSSTYCDMSSNRPSTEKQNSQQPSCPEMGRTFRFDWKPSRKLLSSIFLLILALQSAVCDIREPPENSEETQKLLLSPDIGSGQSDSNSNNGNFGCNEVRYYYNALSQAKGFTAISGTSIPKTAVSGVFFIPWFLRT